MTDRVEDVAMEEVPMFQLKAITPLALPPEELVRRQRRYDRLAAGRLAVTLVNLPDGAPRRLDTQSDVETSAAYVRREVERTSPDRFDAILPDCVLDPCTGELPSAPVPLFGILRLVAGTLAGLGTQFAAVTRNQAIGDELVRKLELYGLGSALDRVRVLDADFCLIADAEGWAEALAPVVAATAASGVPVLVNGCSAVDVAPEAGTGVRVVDPTALALDVLAATARSPQAELLTRPT